MYLKCFLERSIHMNLNTFFLRDVIIGVEFFLWNSMSLISFVFINTAKIIQQYGFIVLYLASIGRNIQKTLWDANHNTSGQTHTHASSVKSIKKLKIYNPGYMKPRLVTQPTHQFPWNQLIWCAQTPVCHVRAVRNRNLKAKL